MGPIRIRTERVNTIPPREKAILCKIANPLLLWFLSVTSLTRHVCVAPPIVVGAWPMAGTLWQLFEYYYYYYFFNQLLHCIGMVCIIMYC